MLAGSGELAVQQAGHQQGEERHQQSRLVGSRKLKGESLLSPQWTLRRLETRQS